MKRLLLLLSLVVFAGACAPGQSPRPDTPPPAGAQDPDTTPAPDPDPIPETEREPVTPEALAEAPVNWHLLDASADQVRGISMLRAERELLAGREPERTVIVAILDSGIDTAHIGLAPNLWQNPDERPDTGMDEDGNGYVDDIRGWNFIGSRDGENVHYDTWEIARLHAACDGQPSSARMAAGADSISCERIASELDENRREAQQTLQQIAAIETMLSRAVPLLEQALETDSLTVTEVTSLRPTRPEVRDAREIYLEMARLGITPGVVEEAKAEYESQLEFKLNPDFEPRPIVGDDYENSRERDYGNRDVTGPDATHGTHVAGIIGGSSENGTGTRGVASSVALMSIRTVPDGDERDKDIANAIRYAVDEGAHIINMSFGKAYSPDKAVVDEAVKYADERGVLMVHAAGNDGEDLSSARAYPSPVYLEGGRAEHWIGVGASSWKGADSLAAIFSNYGPERVDVFAPGEDIHSTVPGGGYEPNSGTSMAAPVVSGVAALLMSYFPELGAAEVRCIILESVTDVSDQTVLRPGDGERVSFGTLSATGGIVNAYEAVRMAEAGERCRGP